MTAGKSRSSRDAKAIVFEDVAQLRKGTVEVTVAKGHDGYSRRLVAAKTSLQVRQELIRYAAGVGRYGQEHDVRRGKAHRFPPFSRLGHIHTKCRYAQPFCQGIAQGFSHAARMANGTKIYDIHVINLHDPVTCLLFSSVTILAHSVTEVANFPIIKI